MQQLSFGIYRFSQWVGAKPPEEPNGIRKLFDFLFAPDIVLNIGYSGINFIITVNDLDRESSLGRHFNIEGRCGSQLLPFTILKKIGFFALSAKDIPLSKISGKNFTVYTNPAGKFNKCKEITINRKRYYFYSDNTEKSAEIIKQPGVLSCLEYLLSKFNSIEITNNKIAMTKYLSINDTKPDNIIKLLDCIVRLAQQIKI